MRMIQRAFREQWPMSVEERREALETCLRVIRDPGADTRAAMAAVSAMIAADNVNAKRESTDTQADSAAAARANQLLQRVLDDPELLERILSGDPPQIPPPSTDTAPPSNGKPH